MKLPALALFLVPCLLPVAAHADACAALTGASGAYYAGITTTQCNTIITINADNSITTTKPNLNPYDGSDDNYVGVVNNSASNIFSIFLTSTTDIFGFDGDGIDAYGIAGNTIDKASYGNGAYGGPNAFFTGINSAKSTGTVNFIGGIAAGGTGFFSLEEAPSTGSTMGSVTGTTPEPGSLLLLATGLVGIAGQARRKLLR